MAMVVPNQATFFYKGKWMPKTDNLLLANVIRLRGVRPLDGNNIPESVVVEAATAINEEISGDFTVTDLNNRLKVLEERFTTFNQVVGTTGVHWNMPENVVTADDEVWKKIFESKPFAGAYYYQDEPDFSQLATLFGMSNIKVEEEAEVIVVSDTTELIILSDTTEVVDNGRHKNVFSPSDADEVTSPITAVTPRVRRKLSARATISTEDRESSNVRRGRSIPVAKTAPKSSPNASSSASWSPFGKDWKPNY